MLTFLTYKLEREEGMPRTAQTGEPGEVPVRQENVSPAGCICKALGLLWELG